MWCLKQSLKPIFLAKLICSLPDSGLHSETHKLFMTTLLLFNQKIHLRHNTCSTLIHPFYSGSVFPSCHHEHLLQRMSWIRRLSLIISHINNIRSLSLSFSSKINLYVSEQVSSRGTHLTSRQEKRLF
jgi:hypothetical protein